MNNIKYISFLFCLFLIACNPKQETLFKLLSPAETGIAFTNTITESDSFNILVKEFVYNGGGVGVGDLNGDGLDDLFFTGNQVENALYLNRGKLKFEEVSVEAKIQKKHAEQWSSGVNILDINLDGKLDIYLCNTLNANPIYRKNLLYINQGNNASNIPIFQEMGDAYGIADESHSSHAQFFDYDNDGDLDLFVGVNWIEREYPNRFVELTEDGSAPNRDNLFQNNWNDSLGHPVFTDVSLEAGIVFDGYSHSTLIYDFNEDGWQDIYVANDYQSDDLIFINNQDGTFRNEADRIFKHFSMSSMGSDLGDINNDGAADFFTSEMQPYYNKQKKLFQGPSNYQNQLRTKEFGYTYQYPRNTLQLNMGNNPATNLPIYSEIGMYAQIQETDWSWSSLFADYDNDGWKDLFVANGFPKNIVDRDFADFRTSLTGITSTDYLLDLIPAIRVPNFVFRNEGDLSFQNKSKAWGMEQPSFSNGAVYADFDRDGDLDLVTNNIDDPAFLYENTSNPLNEEVEGVNFLRIRLEGSAKNPDAFGAKIKITANGKAQTNYLLSARGYISKTEHTFHFGLGEATMVDSVNIYWPDGKLSILANVAANQVLTVKYGDAVNAVQIASEQSPLFQAVNEAKGLAYQHEEVDFADFNFQRTLPHKFSQYGPAVAVADVNGDELEDVFIGGNYTQAPRFFIQQTDASFELQELDAYKKGEEDTGVLFFDADQDGDNDLYLARGSAQFKAGEPLYQDVLWLNDGKGNFTTSVNALPQIYANSSCVKAADYDLDGDLDLFIGGSVKPFSYPYADRSFVLRNDGGQFTDVTAEVLPNFEDIGIVSDALWTDFNGDFFPDLIVASKWQPLQFFSNNDKLLKPMTASGLESKRGWWNSLAAADLDNDGDMDYVAGNFGENLYYRCTAEEPIRVYGKDLDNNGMVDPLISCYWQDSLGNKDEYLYHPRADLVNQYVGIRKKFNTYAEYGEANVSEMFSEEEMAGALILEANYMKSVILENRGEGEFVFHELPIEAQFAPIYGIKATDVNGDERLDLLLIGNDLGIEVQQGRADAINGWVLLNKGNFSFQTVALAESHFYVPAAGIGLASITNNNRELFLATQNRADLKTFQLTSPNNETLLPLNPNEVKAIYFFDGGKRVQEFYWGTGFLSQSGRYLEQSRAINKIELYDQAGNLTRTIGQLQ